jgi:hypothetical protein
MRRQRKKTKELQWADEIGSVDAKKYMELMYIKSESEERKQTEGYTPINDNEGSNELRSVEQKPGAMNQNAKIWIQ